MKVTMTIDSNKSIQIGHSELANIISWSDDDRRHGVFFTPLFDHPASEVRSAVAGKSFTSQDELECLSRDASIEVVRVVANNKRALKMFDAPLILKMISRDVSVAADIAENLYRIRESVRSDVIDALLLHTDPKIAEATQIFVDENQFEDEDDGTYASENDPLVVDDPD